MCNPLATTPPVVGTRVLTTGGRGGMPKVVLSHQSGSSAELYLHGAHLTSWTAPDGDELLFVSELSAWAPDREIRGGVPVVFPQFGRGPLSIHGFARYLDWELTDCGVNDSGAAFARLFLDDSTATHALWPHRFRTELQVRLDDAMEVTLTVVNTGGDPWEFTAGLHNYFRVATVEEASVEGLQGVFYADHVAGGTDKIDRDAAIAITGEVNRVYMGPPAEVHVHDAQNGRTIGVRRYGFDDLVVWNPWTRWSREHDDFGDDEYLNMVCVEPAQLSSPVRIAPGERWSAGQLLSCGAAS